MKKRKNKAIPLVLQVKALRKEVKTLWICKQLQDKVNLRTAKIHNDLEQHNSKQRQINQNLFKVIKLFQQMLELKTTAKHTACHTFLWVLIAMLFWKWLGV